MKIAFIGTGTVAAALAEPWAEAGHTVVWGSRDPDSKKDAPYEVVSHADAVADADVVVNATPGAASVDVLSAIADALDGKVVLDVGNAVNERYDLVYPNSSLGQKLQEALPGARVVKSANSAYIGVIADPAVLTDKGVLFVSGDDDDAKATVTGLLADLGWDADSVIDLGGIATARGPEHYFLLFMTRIGATRNPHFNIRLVS